MKLYHYTCNHGHQGIEETMTVLPNLQHNPLFAPKVSWWTDLEDPDREALGLTSTMLSCDRMAHRWVALDPSGIRPWLGSKEQAETDPHVQADIQRFGDPAHWWVASVPILAAPA